MTWSRLGLPHDRFPSQLKTYPGNKTPYHPFELRYTIQIKTYFHYFLGHECSRLRQRRYKNNDVRTTTTNNIAHEVKKNFLFHSLPRSRYEVVWLTSLVTPLALHFCCTTHAPTSNPNFSMFVPLFCKLPFCDLSAAVEV